ncbi:MAG: cytochrome c3 family protein [Nitrospirae bacterium]|nr:cytochrome c3 family protein [Nitrospirota bacterium]MBI3606005.1 cytochrome c3 family protein [Nitrospirota bacterium]
MKNAFLKFFILPLLITGLLSCVHPETAPSDRQQDLEKLVEKSTQQKETLSEDAHPLAFDYLPKAKQGYVDWVEALRQGIIHPRENLTGDPNVPTMPPLDFNIIFQAKGDIPDVVYPHRPHTEWLDCRNCHPGIFKMQAGSNPVTMEKIIQGEFCGRCHGKVAFPLSDCTRCHSKPKS